MKYFSALAIAVMVLLAGCTENMKKEGSSVQQTGQAGKKTSSSDSGEYLNIIFENFPSQLKEGDERQFSFTIEAKDNLEDVEVLMYNFGSYVESSCNGRIRIGDISKGGAKTRTCTMKLTGAPVENKSQDMKYEVNFKIKQAEAEISVKVYDEVEFERSSPGGGDDSASLENFAELVANPKNVEEGKPIYFNLNIDGSTLTKNQNCNCNIESLSITFPSGFWVEGLDAWTKKVNANGITYTLQKINAPAKKEFTAKLSGVTRSNEFYIKFSANGVWKYFTGSNSFRIVAG